jgi:hypothetical protein
MAGIGCSLPPTIRTLKAAVGRQSRKDQERVAMSLVVTWTIPRSCLLTLTRRYCCDLFKPRCAMHNPDSRVSGFLFSLLSALRL